MLGKVFENLIEENLRKGLGSYYTPREIVHYMCQESLINYLDIALNSGPETIGREKRKPTRREIIPRADPKTFVHLGNQIPYYASLDTRHAIQRTKSIGQHSPL